MIGTVDALTERPVTRAYRPTGHRCPNHPEEALIGGPTQYHCPVGRDGHRVQAADLSKEVSQ